MRYRVTTPVAGYSGSVGSVQFVNGTANVDDATHAAELAYCRARGYDVAALAPDDEQQPHEADREHLEVEAPKRSASTDTWRTYAVEHGGMTVEQAADLSRDQLADHYLGQKETPS